ncbi:glycoside hydrolase family 43 protein [Luteimonas composti]|uniref:Glycoside hydrolase family 43 protein n=1 Tax=Luteimonas composti TaxID=398257 RepID=A0ABT6MNN2_9GAMM|nr:glycoside hydrolase family 43 protein [Luteimonas composti]MDH7452043.1 glycoside hydrolase family 43 protein [Luteimonas composti]
MKQLLLIPCLLLAACSTTAPAPGAAAANPLFTDRHTADPAPLVVGDTLYLYVGHDMARGDEMFNIVEWRVYSTTDMARWTDHGAVMKPTDFKWASRDAWASQAIEKDGKFYFYTTVEHDQTRPGKAIGVAVSDSPTGPFVDARGSALVSNDMTPQGPHTWDDIDPTVFIDDDGTAWLMWGNANFYYARLKPNMVELDGPILQAELPKYVEGPWVHKRGDTYYLTYASMDKSVSEDELVSYATAPAITGPWKYRGEISGPAENSFTIHPGIVEFKGQWYFFYHNGVLTVGDQGGALGRRAVAVEHLYYDADGGIVPIEHTREGVSVPRRH